MELGIIGLGRMGKFMALRLLKNHKVVVHNRSPEPIKEAAKKGAIAAFTLEEMFSKLKSPRIIWTMIPSGEPTEQMLSRIYDLASAGDIVIDGGNSNFKDSKRRYQKFAQKKISYMDIGVSGGLVAAKTGYCLMAGGDLATFKKVEPLLKALSVEDGYGYMGPSGSGHYVKMVHNAIEYGMMQAIGEGFDLLNKSEYSQNLDLKKVANLWNHGSIVRSFLMEMTENAFSKDPKLSSIAGYVEDNGEGRWAVQEAIDKGVAFNVIGASLYARFQSREKDSFAMKVLAAQRLEFGGHSIKEAKKK